MEAIINEMNKEQGGIIGHHKRTSQRKQNITFTGTSFKIIYYITLPGTKTSQVDLFRRNKKQYR